MSGRSLPTRLALGVLVVGALALLAHLGGSRLVAALAAHLHGPR